MRKTIAWLGLGLLASGCGIQVSGRASQPAPSMAKKLLSPEMTSPSQSTTAANKASNQAVIDGCYPWGVRDMKSTAVVDLPVPTQTITGILGAARVTASNLALWVGQTSTQVPVLGGFHLSGLSAQRGSTDIRINPGTGSLTISESSPTTWQAKTIGRGWPTPPSLPILFQISVASFKATTITAAVNHILHTLTRVGSAGLSVSTYWETQASPPKTYLTYAGTLNPSSYLVPASIGENICSRSQEFGFGLAHGRLVKKSFASIMDANGIEVGFAPGTVVLISEHAGIYQAYWYREPAVTVPPQDLTAR